MENLRPAIKMSGGVRVPRKTRTTPPAQASNSMSTIISNKQLQVNQKIARLTEVNFLKLRDVITAGMSPFGDRLVREVWCNRDVYREFREDKAAWLFRHLFKPADNVRIVLADDLNVFILKTFKLRGQQLVLSYIDSIDSMLVERQRSAEEPLHLNQDRFGQALEFFGLPTGERVTFGAIRRLYDERIAGAAEDERVRINEEFVYLRDNYQTYLQSLGVSA